MARTMHDLSVFAFVNFASITLIRRDSYLDHFKSGIKHDTLAAVRVAPFHYGSLFSDNVIQKAVDEITNYNHKHYSTSSHKNPGRYYSYSQSLRSAQDAGWKSSLKNAQLPWSKQKRSGQGLQLLTATC